LKLLSFVIPCYRSEKTIQKVVDEIIEVVGQRPEYDYEVIAVNDCSPDNVYDVLVKMATDNNRIKVINFARNMGKHSAVLAGYGVAKGEYIVTLDDDFQSPTYELWKMLEPLENNECDVTTAEYFVKKESLFKRAGSNVNLLMTQALLDKPKGVRTENLLCMKRFVCQEMVKYKNPYPFLEGLMFRVTKEIKAIPMEQRERGDDNATGFTLKKSVELLLNGLTAFSVKPLRMATFLGFVFAAIGFIYGIYTVIHKLVDASVAVGYSSMMSVLLISMGMIMLMLGLIGEYLGRIYICLNASPQYVIRNTINLEKEQ